MLAAKLTTKEEVFGIFVTVVLGIEKFEAADHAFAAARARDANL